MKETDKLLIRLVRKNKTPSVHYAIFNKDFIIHRFFLGFADIKNRTKTDEKTAYNLYSITKTFTALAVLQLAERNKCDIDQPVIKYLHDFPYSSDITVRQLMAHTSGIPNPIPLSWIHAEAVHKTFDRDAFFRQVFSGHNKMKSRPNRKFAYSNLGYVFLGQLIEKISGMSYEDYVRKNILEPINITSDELDFIIGLSSLYQNNNILSNVLLGLLINKTVYMDEPEEKWRPFRRNYVNGASYGGLIGTANAMIRYVQELLKPDCCLLSGVYSQMMLTENYTGSNKPTGMCLSWFKGHLNGTEYFTHAGGGGGYYSEVRIYPSLGKGSVIMFNRTGMRDERFLNRIDKHFIGEKEHINFLNPFSMLNW